jgi:hypothetical protein
MRKGNLGVNSSLGVNASGVPCIAQVGALLVAYAKQRLDPHSTRVLLQIKLLVEYKPLTQSFQKINTQLLLNDVMSNNK